MRGELGRGSGIKCRAVARRATPEDAAAAPRRMMPATDAAAAALAPRGGRRGVTFALRLLRAGRVRRQRRLQEHVLAQQRALAALARVQRVHVQHARRRRHQQPRRARHAATLAGQHSLGQSCALGPRTKLTW